DRQVDRQRNSDRVAAQAGEARSDVAPNNARERQDGRAVRAVRRKRPLRLFRDACAAGAAARAAAAARIAGAGRVRSASSQLKSAEPRAEARGQTKESAAVHRGARGQQVAVEAAEVVVIVVKRRCRHTRCYETTRPESVAEVRQN